MYILLIDDHTLFREALLLVLKKLEADIVVLEAANAEEAAQLIISTRNIDLILLDIDLPDVNGLTALPSLRELAPTVSMVVLTGSEAPQHVKQALDHGVVGYIPKSSTIHELLAALRIVLQGDVYLPPKLLGRLKPPALSLTTVHNHQHTKNILTLRQTEVLELMAQGLPNKTIARKLNIEESTLKHHVSTILHNLMVHNRTQAVVEATRLGLLNTSNPSGI